MISFFKCAAARILVGALLVIAGAAGYAQAAAPAGASQAAQSVLPAMPSLVEKVHGCHRGVRVGPATGIRHRHVGHNCVWVRASARNACARWLHICRNRCLDFGAPNMRYCIRRCFARNAPGYCL
ncbi:MAG: hypothetical protein AAFW82_06960 [Pseudomonadota bacterium]